MKKFLWILLAVLLSNVDLMAQGEKGDLDLGFGIMPALTWVRSDDTDLETKAKIGFGYGLIADYFFAPRYAFSTGFIVMHGGTNYDAFEPISNNKILTTKLRLQYLEIPLTLKVKTNDFGNMTYFGQLGLTPSVLIRTRYDADFVDGSIPDIESKSASDLTRPVALAFTIGGGVEYSLAPNTRAFGSLYFNNGFTTLLSKDVSDDKSTFSYLGLRVGIFF